MTRDIRYLRRPDLAAFEARIAALYGTRGTRCLTMGTTTGCLAAVLALGRRHRSVWVLRNCHRSIINGLILAGLAPRFIAPAGLVITPAELAARFGAAGAAAPTAIIFTNPTFEGWGMDLAPCVALCRRQGLEILVEESHGSHWPASPLLPASALGEDVDLVLHSLHKYVGGLVQTALLHLPARSRLSLEELDQSLDLLETTTLSNLLLLSAETAADGLFDPAAAGRIQRLAAGLARIRRRHGRGGELVMVPQVPGAVVLDPLKVYVTSPRADGEALAKAFMAAGVDHELYDGSGVLFIFSHLNRPADLRRFDVACARVRADLAAAEVRLPLQEPGMQEPTLRMTPREAHFAPRRRLSVAAAQGLVAAELIATCPPGWPLLIPGEEVGPWHRQRLGAERLIEVVAD
jgi:arginine/lysine/ornithine decarboxylase